MMVFVTFFIFLFLRMCFRARLFYLLLSGSRSVCTLACCELFRAAASPVEVSRIFSSRLVACFCVQTPRPCAVFVFRAVLVRVVSSRRLPRLLAPAAAHLIVCCLSLKISAAAILKQSFSARFSRCPVFGFGRDRVAVFAVSSPVGPRP